MPGTVRIQTDQYVGTLIFDYPERRNAISLDMWLEIPRAVRTLEDDPDVRVVILRGAGDVAFISGADISEFGETRAGENAARYDAANERAFEALLGMNKPVIALIHGFCVGGGVAIALTADMRYAADDAVFAIPAARLGLGYPASGIETLISVVGASAAKEFFFTAKRFDAEEALARRLLNEVRPKAELEAFVDCVRTRRAPLVGGLEGREALALAERVMVCIEQHAAHLGPPETVLPLRRAAGNSGEF